MLVTGNLLGSQNSTYPSTSYQFTHRPGCCSFAKVLLAFPKTGVRSPQVTPGISLDNQQWSIEDNRKARHNTRPRTEYFRRPNTFIVLYKNYIDDLRTWQYPITDTIFILNKSICFRVHYLLTYCFANITFIPTIFISVDVLGSQRCAMPLNIPTLI